MTPFEWLIVGHLIGDFLLQTNWMARYKATRWFPLLCHVTVYTAVLTLMGWYGFGGLPVWAIVLIFLTHTLLDRRSFVIWWVRTVMRTDEKDAPSFLPMIVDQVMHILAIVIVVHYFL